jgi:hypothetical protein
MKTLVHETTGRRVEVADEQVDLYTANGWKEQKDAGKPRGRASVSRKKPEPSGDDES